MIITTTPNIEGHSISRYLDVVCGEVILGIDVLNDLPASFHNVIGGRSSGYEQTLTQARNEAKKIILQQAEEQGANAIVGVTYDYEAVGLNNRMFMVVITGTAVVVD